MSKTQSTSKAAVQRRWLSGVGRQAPTAMFWAVCAPLLDGAFMIIQAWFLANTLDQAIRLSIEPAQLLGAMATIAGLIILRASINWSGEQAASHAAETIKLQIRRQLFALTLAKGPAWSKQHPIGTLTVSLIDQVQALDGYLQRYLPAVISAVILPFAIALVVLPVDWVVAALFLVTAPLIPLFMALIGMRAEAANQKHQRVLSRLSGVFSDRIRGLFTLALLGRTTDEVRSVRSASVALSQTTMKVLRIAFLSSAVLELFAALGVAGVAVYIGLSYLGMLGSHFTGFSLHHGLFCLLLAPEVYNPLRKMAASYHDRATAKVAVDELHQLYEQLPPLTNDLPTPSRSAVVQFHETGAQPLIQVEQLQLKSPTGVPLLHVTDFSLDRGQHVALMGRVA
nr:ABC transporter transmembrane domain-containing protein [Paenalcaligenes hominis]